MQTSCISLSVTYCKLCGLNNFEKSAQHLNLAFYQGIL